MDGVLWVLVGFVALWIVLDRTAATLESFSGEAGLVVCAAVLGAAIGVEWILSRCRPGEALTALGLRRAHNGMLAFAAVLCAGLLCFYPLFSLVTGASLTLRDNWLLLLPGLFAQGGVAEETVFRGFLFRRLRVPGFFWKSALRASVPFALVHMLLFVSLDFPVALAALLLAVSLSFPLAWLFEASGGSIWPGALLHFTVQGSVKLVDAGGHPLELALWWMALSATVPWLVFLKRPH